MPDSGVTEVAILDLADLGPTPVGARVDAVEVVVWRTADGSIGIVARQCPHLDWDLVEGVPDGSTLRCPGHGWSIDADGRVYKRNEFGREDDKGCTQHWSSTVRDGKIWTRSEPRREVPGGETRT